MHRLITLLALLSLCPLCESMAEISVETRSISDLSLETYLQRQESYQGFESQEYTDYQDYQRRVKERKPKNPKLATWLSVALPGAGQVYNGHWYKVPIIYAGAAALIYFGVTNKQELNIYRQEYRVRMDPADSLSSPNPNLAIYTDENILTLKNYYQRNFELVLIFTGVLYALNIIDALVFSHLSTFDVSDNLSMRIKPYARPAFDFGTTFPMHAGLSLCFTLK